MDEENRRVFLIRGRVSRKKTDSGEFLDFLKENERGFRLRGISRERPEKGEEQREIFKKLRSWRVSRVKGDSFIQVRVLHLGIAFCKNLKFR